MHGCLFYLLYRCLSHLLTSPIASPVIIVLNSDESVTYTANKISELLNHNPIIVHIESFQEKLILTRIVGPVIYVGHGTPKGIKIQNRVINWRTFAEEIQYTPAKMVYIAACYSEHFVKIMNRIRPELIVFGFKGLVDVDEAAYMIASLINTIVGNLNKANTLLSELTEIMLGKILTPLKYHLWLLGYQTKQIRGIWHVKYYQYRPNYVRYTHPDNYYHYRIPIDQFWETGDLTYLYVMHIPPWAVGVGSAAYGAIIGEAIGGPVGAIIGAIIGALLGNAAVPDENGEGWLWIKDYITYRDAFGNIYARQFDYKLGGICWSRAYIIPGALPATWPLWYGWLPELGLGGW